MLNYYKQKKCNLFWAIAVVATALPLHTMKNSPSICQPFAHEKIISTLFLTGYILDHIFLACHSPGKQEALDSYTLISTGL